MMKMTRAPLLHLGLTSTDILTLEKEVLHQPCAASAEYAAEFVDNEIHLNISFSAFWR